MRLEPLVEEVDLNLIESSILSEGKKKEYVIRGPFMECNIKNRNQRIYPSKVVRKPVESYQQIINEQRAVGELDHPDGTLEINPKNISHKITELKWEGDNVILGEAKICSTPNGMIVRSLMDDGIKLGVSSRGAGSLKEGIVQNDFRLVTPADIVWTPSAPHAFVENILEAKTEWALENGILIERDVDDYKARLEDFKGEKLDNVLLDIFTEAFDRASRRVV